ncbi:MAG: Holliday junction branch migration DNA helicase RuvB [Candidatus Ryanbacteria bacterium CG10_big_fil_rev_8_21_14_0_10_43_42]|uniref:Holliday junction branch migration complex subunit RuvB n=1 Tax=Candidatus Ryanbacteria bacterium CG10_big_fil_rev_8_21_14_0_10_43_42 TaxID=1974864 RepID=A0A2M8KWB3_9BACT|nr:MAG: Holliday junction branch migration DNA helicase RuvB [Candidatus Ryanbacteria bacterium CG10_big_fil_rev_8_21_14_0_10_43_42]
MELKNEHILTPAGERDDKSLDMTLRPQTWDDYIGQSTIKENLSIFIEAAKKRGEPMEHALFYGPPGLGKTTLAHLIAKEMGSQIRITSGPAIERVGDLASILTNLSPGDILFIDEVHRLNKLVEEILYPAMESRSLDIVLGKGPSARVIQLDLPPFTLLAATTRIALLSSPLRSRFAGGVFRLNFYTENDIERIITRSANILSVPIDADATHEIARRSRFTPRVANRLLKRCRDYAEVRGTGTISSEMSTAALQLLEIDGLGLDTSDRRILTAIIEKYRGGPVGVQTLAASTAEEIETIEDVHEPYLLQLGFLERTPRGRIATARAYDHMGVHMPEEHQKKLL